MAVTIRQIAEAMEKFTPARLAEPWDQIGLFLGSPDQEVKKVRLALGVSPEVVTEAAADQVDLLITHHPIWLKPPTFFSETTVEGKMMATLIRNRIGLFSAHTNLDACRGGVNDALADLLNLEEVKPLSQVQEEWLKLTVFVPMDHLEKVRQAIGDTGAGMIGDYSHCSFYSQGTGSFLPLEGANPAIGSVGKAEEVSEARLESIFPAKDAGKIVTAMIEAHPYEEVAYDLVLLKNKMNSDEGIGRTGILSRVMTLGEFADVVKAKLSLLGLRVYGDLDKKIKKVALCGGSGMSLLSDAIKSGSDVYLTGDIKHHDAEEALANGVALIDGGHYGTERGILPVLAKLLEEEFDIEVSVSKAERELFQYR